MKSITWQAESWEHAVELAKSERVRTKKITHAIEYVVDGETYWEAITGAIPMKLQAYFSSAARLVRHEEY